MDTKKFTAALVAAVLTMPVIATADPGTLALIEVGLIGLLCVLRRRRTALQASGRYR